MTGTSSIPIIIEIIVIIKRRILINRFRDTNTTAAFTAKTLEELNLSRQLSFYKLFIRNIIVEVNGKYYLDEQKLIEYRSKRIMILIPVLFILILLIFLDIFLTKY